LTFIINKILKNKNKKIKVKKLNYKINNKIIMIILVMKIINK